MLTVRQTEILDFIRQHAEATGSPPTRAEIVAAFGFRSATAAEDHLRALARKGALELVPGSARGIRLPPSGLPLVGRVAAGSPILSEGQVERHVPVAANLFSPRAHLLLRVRGESMREAGILDGDLLAVHQTPEARNGQIVVARIEDEITVKRFRQQGARVHLLPANPDFDTIVVDPRRQSFAIEGLVVGVLRTEGLSRP